MRATPSIVCCLLLVAGCLPAPSHAADWPSWRGPNRNGATTESNWRPQAAEGIPTIVWESNVGIGYATVSIKDGQLYTIGNKLHSGGGGSSRIDTVYCLDARTGKEIWRFPYPCELGNEDWPGPKPTPAIDGDRVYTLSDAGVVSCLDANSGGVRWRVDLVKQQWAERGSFGFSSSPAIEGDLVLLNVSSAGLALDKHTGKKVWVSPPGPCSFSTPVVYSQDDKRKIALFSARRFQIVDVATGAVDGWYPWATSAEENSADPIVWGETVFISSAYGMGCALLKIAKGELPVVWQHEEMSNLFTSSVLVGDHLYGFDGPNRRCSLKCLSMKTGEITWSEKLGFGSLIVADNKLIVLTEQGTLHVAEASPEAYREIARGRVQRGPVRSRVERGKEWWSAPVLSDGYLYARNHAGDLVCLDLR